METEKYIVKYKNTSAIEYEGANVRKVIKICKEYLMNENLIVETIREGGEYYVDPAIKFLEQFGG